MSNRVWYTLGITFVVLIVVGVFLIGMRPRFSAPVDQPTRSTAAVRATPTPAAAPTATPAPTPTPTATPSPRRRVAAEFRLRDEASGAAIPDAVLFLRNVDSGRVERIQTNNRGIASAESLMPATRFEIGAWQPDRPLVPIVSIVSISDQADQQFDVFWPAPVETRVRLLDPMREPLRNFDLVLNGDRLSSNREGIIETVVDPGRLVVTAEATRSREGVSLSTYRGWARSVELVVPPTVRTENLAYFGGEDLAARVDPAIDERWIRFAVPAARPDGATVEVFRRGGLVNAHVTVRNVPWNRSLVAEVRTFDDLILRQPIDMRGEFEFVGELNAEVQVVIKADSQWDPDPWGPHEEAFTLMGDDLFTAQLSRNVGDAWDFRYTITLPDMIGVEGNVRYPDGRPAPLVRVIARGYRGTETTYRRDVRTTVDGDFRLSVPRADLHSFHPAPESVSDTHRAIELEWFSNEALERESVEIVLLPSAYLSGTVRSSSGATVAGADVRLLAAGEARANEWTESGTDGRWELPVPYIIQGDDEPFLLDPVRESRLVVARHDAHGMGYAAVNERRPFTPIEVRLRPMVELELDLVAGAWDTVLLSMTYLDDSGREVGTGSEEFRFVDSPRERVTLPLGSYPGGSALLGVVPPGSSEAIFVEVPGEPGRHVLWISDPGEDLVWEWRAPAEE